MHQVDPPPPPNDNPSAHGENIVDACPGLWRNLCEFEVEAVSISRTGRTWKLATRCAERGTVVTDISKILCDGVYHLALFGTRSQQDTERIKYIITSTAASHQTYQKKETIVSFSDMSPGTTYSSSIHNVNVEGRVAAINNTKVKLYTSPRMSILFEDANRDDGNPSTAASTDGTRRFGTDTGHPVKMRIHPVSDSDAMGTLLTAIAILLAGFALLLLTFGKRGQ